MKIGEGTFGKVTFGCTLIPPINPKSYLIPGSIIGIKKTKK